MFAATFSAQDGEASSSFNYTGYSTLDLNQGAFALRGGWFAAPTFAEFKP